MEYTNKKACQIIDWERKIQSNDVETGHCQFVPPVSGSSRFWNKDDMAAGLFYLDQRKAGLTVKIAGQTASRLRTGMRDYPDADQLTVVTIGNGSVSIVPTSSVDLSSGNISGGYVATALMVDTRNLRARVQRLIDADAAIIGDEDDA